MENKNYPVKKYPDWMFQEDGVSYAVVEYADGTIKRERLTSKEEIQKGASKRRGSVKRKPCGSCGKHNHDLEPVKMGVRELAQGAIGKLKSISGIGIAPQDVIDMRLEICTPCEHRSMKHCSICHCPISDKTRIASESCPAGFWDRVDGVLVEGEVIDR